MQLHIKGRNLLLAPAVIERIERRLRFALSRFADCIDRVTVQFADLNGPRGGVDKQCRIVVKLRRGGEVVVEDTATDLETAIDRGADRAQRAVARALARMHPTEDSPSFVPTEDQS
ncbi:MAG: HPF/RaiA family ribosome-associated protein [Deltaproteobacteria bacterium]|nr:HPF/RaiA family ribosome-associated protein [Deltaproteobacteria bacterium]